MVSNSMCNFLEQTNQQAHPLYAVIGQVCWGVKIGRDWMSLSNCLSLLLPSQSYFCHFLCVQLSATPWITGLYHGCSRVHPWVIFEHPWENHMVWGRYKDVCAVRIIVKAGNFDWTCVPYYILFWCHRTVLYCRFWAISGFICYINHVILHHLVNQLSALIGFRGNQAHNNSSINN